MATDPIELLIEPRHRPVGNGTVRRILPWSRRRMIGPFIFADLMGPEQFAPGAGVDVDAHPHIGLSTLTYLFAGRLVHRDSTGAVASIEPGAVNWMTAGAGVTHTERSHPDDRRTGHQLHGVQTWVALPFDAEEAAPFFEHHDPDAIPSDERRGASIRLVAGRGWGLESPVSVSSALVQAELAVDGDGTLAIDRTHPERGVLAVDGDLRLAGRSLPAGHLAVLASGTRPLLSGRGRAMVLGGDPVGPRHIWWNFVHSDPDRIEAAKADWVAQRFPIVPGDHDPWVSLPG